MRRLFVAAALCAAFLLLAGPAFADLTRQAGHGRVTPAPHVPRKATPSLRSFTPLGARMAAAVSVTGTVYDSSHSALGNVQMEWWSRSDADQKWNSGTMASQYDGSYTASPQATTSGEIWAYLDDAWWGRLDQTWTAGNTYPVDLYPGRVNVAATRGGPWKTFQTIAVDLQGDNAFSHGAASTTDTVTSPTTVQVDALDGAYTKGSVNFWQDEGVEFSSALTVTSGLSPGRTIDVGESGAQRVQFSGYKYSGKPGTTVKVKRENFPAGWRNYVTGSSDPGGTAYSDYGAKLSRGGANEALSVKVPSTAKPGYAYWIGFQHIDASGELQPLYIETAYQVCTMKPSKTSVTKRTRIRVSGIVPTEGHWGSRAGNRKAVVLWWHNGTAPVPATWYPKKKGWVVVGSMRTTGTGSYRTPYFKVPRTGTLVVQYAGDDWYFGGFTSTARVAVR